MLNLVASTLSLCVRMTLMFAFVIATNWLIQTNVWVSGYGAPLSAFPQQDFRPDDAIVYDPRGGRVDRGETMDVHVTTR